MSDVAYIGKIVDLQNIAQADRLEYATVVCGSGGKWHGCVSKGQFNVGDLVEVYLPDAIVPSEERFSFLNDKRIRIQKLRGVRSECLIMPLTVEGAVGTPLECEKYFKPDITVNGNAAGAFPSHIIPKTDEVHFQRVPEMVDYMRGKPVVITQKCDGASTTIYNYQGTFGVCSRNLQLKRSEGNVRWLLVEKYSLEQILPDGWALQAELVGPGIQKNPMGLPEIDLKVFDIWDIEKREYIDYIEFCKEHGIPMVMRLPENSFTTDEDLLEIASRYKYTSGKPQEGIVVRTPVYERFNGMRCSFKVINPLYKD